MSCNFLRAVLHFSAQSKERKMMKEECTSEIIKQLKKRNKLLEKIVLRERQESEERRNQQFVQLYKEPLRELRKLAQEDKNALTVLLILVEKMNKRNAIIISQTNLMKITGKSRRSISSAIKALKKHSFINIIKSGAANIYIVNSNVFWQSDNKTKQKFSIFDATVYATLDEQEKDYQENWEGVKLKSVPVVEDAQNIEEQLEVFEGEH